MYFRRSECHVFFWCLLVGQIKEEDAGQSADQEDDIKPAVIEVELQLSQNLCHNGAILQWHAHTHQQHRWHEIHPLLDWDAQKHLIAKLQLQTIWFSITCYAMFTILQLSLMFTTTGYCWYLNQHRQVEASATWKQLCLMFIDIFFYIFLI